MAKSIRYDELDKMLDKLHLSFLNITPLNLAEEKKKFFDSETYNPQFRYKQYQGKNDEIIKKIKSIDRVTGVDPRIEQFYLQLIGDKIATNNMMRAVGNNDKFTKIAQEKYGMPSPILFRNACRVLRRKLDAYDVILDKNVKRGDFLDFAQAVAIFRKVFDGMGLDDWEAVASENISDDGVKTGMKAKKIYLSKKFKKSKFAFKKTIIHEIGTHVLRGENGFNTGVYPLGKPNLDSYLLVEEGLAMYNEEKYGVLTERSLIKRAVYVWLIYIASQMSFRETYNAVSGFLLKRNAFDAVYRVKRGLSDTSMPGIFPKDFCYFRGFRYVRRMIRRYPYWYELLYAGKISFKQISWVEDGLISKPKLILNKKIISDLF